MELLLGLCPDRHAEAQIAALFRDSLAEAWLRTEAGVCLLDQDEAKYHREVVVFAEHSPANLLQFLFNQLVGLGQSGIDPAVVRMGFALLFEEGSKQVKAKERGQTVSDYGQFIYAAGLSKYLGAIFEPDRKSAIYAGPQGTERWYHDAVMNALTWWSKHKHEYVN